MVAGWWCIKKVYRNRNRDRDRDSGWEWQCTPWSYIRDTTLLEYTNHFVKDIQSHYDNMNIK